MKEREHSRHTLWTLAKKSPLFVHFPHLMAQWPFFICSAWYCVFYHFGQLVGCVDVCFFYSKFVKSQKDIREQSARMTSKPLFKVKEEMTSLKQMVSALASGLHRNSVAIEALKVDTGKELKHAEISQRTKDTPPGLQYENTAPTE